MTLTALSSSARAVARIDSADTTPIVRAEGARTVVVLRGEEDIATRPVLAEVLSRLIATDTRDVVIDLGEVEFIDSSTIRALEVGQEFLSREGRNLTVRSPSRLALRMLGLFGLTDLIETQEGRSQPCTSE
jgi:anti-sigma B factor antagonist